MIKFRPGGAKREKISLLMIGNTNYCNIMNDAIEEVNNSSHKLELMRIRAESVDIILESSASHVHIDFVVFLLDTTNRNVVDYVTENVSKLDHPYMCGRITLVNCSNKIPQSKMGCNAEELSSLCQKYGASLIHDDIMDPDGRTSLASRILNLLVITCGLNFGVPVPIQFTPVTFPFD